MTTTEPASRRTRVAIVGLGQQGTGIAGLVCRQGYDLVGGVDIGPKVGQRIGDFAPDVAGDARVYGSISELLEATHGSLDVVILAAAIDQGTTLGHAREVLTAGINVLTLHPDLFEPVPEWADELQALGEKTGASFLATGMQDPWWVQMPATAAASTNNISRVEVEHLIDANSIPVHIMESLGLGSDVSEFDSFREATESLPPILGAPLRVAARAMGFEPGELTTAISPIVTETPMTWATAERELPAGTVIGTEEVTAFTTDAGVEFRGYLRLRIFVGDEQPSDIVTIKGEPTLRLEHRPFPGQKVTNSALVARIPDIIAASGGVHSAADLGPAHYRHPVKSILP